MKTIADKLAGFANSVFKAAKGESNAHPAKPIVDLGPGSMPGHFWA